MKEIQVYEMVNCPQKGRFIIVGQCLDCPWFKELLKQKVQCTYDQRGD